MSEIFNQFDCDGLRILQSVQMLAHPDLPTGVGVIELSFLDCAVFVCIEDEYDTLLCTRTRPESHVSYTCSLSAHFWEPILRKTLTDAWQMTSDRGYPDALQLRFRDQPNAGQYTTVQLYGEASQITITEFKAVRQYSVSGNSPQR